MLLNHLFEKFPNSDIIDISEYLGKKTLKNIMGIAFIMLFFFAAFLTLSDFSNMIKTIYFGRSPIIFILLFFLCGALIANLVGFKSIIRTICLVVPFTLASILLALFSVSSEFTLDKFVPIFGYNFHTTFINGLLNTFALYIITYYYFLIPLLQDGFEFKKITIISYSISWLLLLLTVLSILIVFPITNHTEPLNSLYLMSRKVELGDFLQRLDALFVLLWMISIFCYLSISIFMINRIFGKLTSTSNTKMITYSTTSILFGLCVLPLNKSITIFLENTVYRYIIIGLVFMISLMIMIFANLKFCIKKGSFK